jgi:hypothetical protein
MANRRWLQKGDVVQNPFYGKSMSECGRIITGTDGASEKQ